MLPSNSVQVEACALRLVGGQRRRKDLARRQCCLASRPRRAAALFPWMAFLRVSGRRSVAVQAQSTSVIFPSLFLSRRALRVANVPSCSSSMVATHSHDVRRCEQCVKTVDPLLHGYYQGSPVHAVGTRTTATAQPSSLLN